MSETLLNRARLNDVPQGQPFSAANSQSQILLSGVVASAPLVALAYSYAVLPFEGNASHSGNKITVECGDNSITITLDRYGQAELSLVPFIRADIEAHNILDNPLYCDDSAETQDNGFRGYIDVSITEDGREPVAMRIYYIFGNHAPTGEQVTDLYFDYDANVVRGVDTMLTLPDSKVKVALITTNEELMIARDTMHIVQNEEE